MGQLSLSFLLLSAYVCIWYKMELLLQERIPQELLGRSPGSSHPVSETLPGNQSLVHISARNHVERETAAWVFSVPGSRIGLFFMEDCYNLAKGQLVLHPVLRPFCLPAAFYYLMSYTWRITAFTREDAA